MEGEYKLGAMLREAREMKGTTLAQVEKATRIRLKYLEALEADNDADLPEPVFVKGFLRNYALYLGLDAQEVLDIWRREHGVKKEVADVHSEIEPLRTPSRITPALLTVVLALVVFSIVMYYLYQQYAALPLSPTPTIAFTTPTATPTAVTSAQPAGPTQTPVATRVPTASVQEVAVPDVAGMTLQEADEALRAVGLRIEVIERRYSDAAAAGIVLSQSVRAQTKVQKDSVIGVTLSRGSQAVSVPRLVGLAYPDAVARLSALGLTAQRIEVSAQGAPNSVVGQDPAENAQVAPNSVVKLTVSVGDVVTVPDVRGMTLEAGKEALLKAGLVIGQVSMQGRDKLPASELSKVCVGCVLSTDPPTGRIVPRGTLINMGVRSE